MKELNKNGEVLCPYCNGTGGKDIKINKKSPSFFSRFLKGRIGKVEVIWEDCYCCKGTKMINWIDAVIKPIPKPPPIRRIGF